MRVRMRVTISGTRDGHPWPERGESVDLPDSEAEHLLAAGLATTDEEPAEGEAPEENATVPGTPEKATGRKPAAKPAAQK